MLGATPEIGRRVTQEAPAMQNTAAMGEVMGSLGRLIGFNQRDCH